MLLLNRDDLTAALPMSSAIEAMKWAYEAWSTRRAVVPPRIHLELPEHAGVMLVMPAYVPARTVDERIGESLVVKTVSVCPGNMARGLPAVQGMVQVFDSRTGACQALLDGATLTALRTGAGSGVATDILARPEATSVAILGAGVQARAQLLAVCCVRPIQQIRIFSRTRSRAEDLVRDLADNAGLSADIQVVDSPAEAVRDADIICTATTSTTPTFDAADVAPGTHINAVGAFKPGMVEVPPATLAQATLFVDSCDSIQTEAGDLIHAIQLGMLRESDVRGEIGQVLSGALAGRRSPDEVTVFKSVGLAAQDAAAASVAIARAKQAGLGQWIAWN